MDGLTQVTAFFKTFDSNLSHCGFIYKYNALTESGQVGEELWTKYWMEIWGSLIKLYRVPDELASFPYTASLSPVQFIKIELDPPQELMNAIKASEDVEVINFSDSTAELLPPTYLLTQAATPPIPYTSCFALTTTSANLYLFASASIVQTNAWVTALRLSLFESRKLHQLFTRRILQMAENIKIWSTFEIEPFASASYRGDVKFEGSLQIRLPYSNVWTQLHVVVTSKSGLGLKGSKLFGTKKEVRDKSRRGALLFYENGKAAKRGKMPILVINDVVEIFTIFGKNSSDPDKATLAKVEGTFQGLSDSTSVERSFGAYQEGFKELNTFEDVEALVSGQDSRPLPTELLILAPSASELTNWIIATLSAFSIDSTGDSIEEEVLEICKTQTWPTELFLSVEEMSGLTMPITSYRETKNIFAYYLAQKVSLSKQQKLDMWADEVAKGNWERSLNDRKEMEFKIKELYGRVEKIMIELRKNGIDVTKPKPSVLVAAMTSIVAWLGPILNSMIAPESPTVIAPKPVELKEDSSDGEGSVSDEELSDQGSISDEEESEEEPTVDDPRDSQVAASFQVYAPNSLLAYEKATKRLTKPPGPYFAKTPSLVIDNPYADNSLTAHSRQATVTAVNMKLGLLGKKEPETGPLLGVVNEEARKPQVQGGLLGEMERRKVEMQFMKKNGITDIRVDSLTPQISLGLQQMSQLLLNPQSNPAVFDNLRNVVAQMSSLLVQYNTRKNSTSTGFEQLNPYAVPNVTWNQSSNISSSDGRSVGAKSILSSSEKSSADSSSIKFSSGTESYKSSSDNEDISLHAIKFNLKSEQIGATNQNSSSEDSDTDIPLGHLAAILKPSKKKKKGTSSAGSQSDESE